MGDCVGFRQKFVEISIAQLLLIKAADFRQHEVTIEDFSEFIFIPADYKNRREDFVVKGLITCIVELVISD